MDNKFVKIGINLFTSAVVALVSTGVIPAGSESVLAAAVALVAQVVNLIAHIKATPK